jgi:hypothetical protein
MRIRFLSDQVYDTGGPGQGPRFPAGFVLDESGVPGALGLSKAPSPAWTAGFMHRWLNRKVAEVVDGRTPVSDPHPLDHDANGRKGGAVDGSDDDEDDDDGIEKHTVAELKELAAAENVELAADLKKAEIVEAIRAARAAA